MPICSSGQVFKSRWTEHNAAHSHTQSIHTVCHVHLFKPGLLQDPSYDPYGFAKVATRAASSQFGAAEACPANVQKFFRTIFRIGLGSSGIDQINQVKASQCAGNNISRKNLLTMAEPDVTKRDVSLIAFRHIRGSCLCCLFLCCTCHNTFSCLPYVTIVAVLQAINLCSESQVASYEKLNSTLASYVQNQWTLAVSLLANVLFSVLLPHALLL